MQRNIWQGLNNYLWIWLIITLSQLQPEAQKETNIKGKTFYSIILYMEELRSYRG